MKALFDYIESLTVGQGRGAGQPFRLFPWQRKFLRGTFSQPDDALLSVARGAGKTTFVSAIAAATLDGPLAEPMAETLIVASSFQQGLTAFRHILHFLDPAIEREPKRWRVHDSTGTATIQDRESKAILRVIGSDPRRAHSAAPKLILADEVAQWEETKIDRMIAALETSLGKIEGSRIVWLGTRPATPEHAFEGLRKLVGYEQVHAARPDDPIFQRRTWKRANPGLDWQPDLEAKIRNEAKRAKLDANALARFRALRLNLGVSDSVEDLLLDPEVWAAAEIGADNGHRETLQGESYVLGIDLGQSSAMSAAAAYGPTSGVLDSFALFPEQPGLRERGLKDGVESLYQRCAERGELLQAGLKTTDIPALLAEVLDRWGAPAAIVADTWRYAELSEKLEQTEFPQCPLILRRNGPKDGAEDCRRFRRRVLDGKVQPVESKLMRSAMAGARVQRDAEGNVRLSKGGGGRRLRHRDDAAAAAILAIAEGDRWEAHHSSQPMAWATSRGR